MARFLSLITPLFMMQVIMSISITYFCMHQIALGGVTPIYWSTITLLIGYWLPTPMVDLAIASKAQKPDQR
jgi:hypothetical protein